MVAAAVEVKGQADVSASSLHGLVVANAAPDSKVPTDGGNRYHGA
jgi:hypothetical protein